MKKYKEYVSEDDSVKHMVTSARYHNGYHFQTGDIYYTKKDEPAFLHRNNGPAIISITSEKRWLKDGDLHRLDGPAIIYPDGKETWYVYGIFITKNINIPDEWKWELLRGNIESIKVIFHPTKQMQKYVIENRPDLIGEIDGLDPELVKRYPHEVELSRVDI